MLSQIWNENSLLAVSLDHFEVVEIKQPRHIRLGPRLWHDIFIKPRDNGLEGYRGACIAKRRGVKGCVFGLFFVQPRFQVPNGSLLQRCSRRRVRKWYLLSPTLEITSSNSAYRSYLFFYSTHPIVPIVFFFYSEFKVSSIYNLAPEILSHLTIKLLQLLLFFVGQKK